jgi:guanine nucleotide-binding protein G(i) subunit alpha
MNLLKTICQDSKSFQAYLPSDTDILYLRKQTLAVTESSYKICEQQYIFYDFPGQVNKRARWAPYFDNLVDSIIFTVSIAAYDQLVPDSIAQYRYLDSLAVFQDLMENELLAKNTFVVLLNKCDILKEKLSKLSSDTKLSKYIPNYRGIYEM